MFKVLKYFKYKYIYELETTHLILKPDNFFFVYQKITKTMLTDKKKLLVNFYIIFRLVPI